MRHQNNLTALRWIAAGLVLYGHSFVMLGLPEPFFMSWIPMGPLGVFVFFAISGYLVAQSWENDPHVFRFLQRRALRIFPGLVACTFITVIFLGTILTTLPLVDYFRNANTWGYFSNIVLYITYNLPGVFSDNRYPVAINGSLWSLPAEFSMYLLLGIFGLLRVPRFGWIIAVVALMYLSKSWAMQAQEQLVVYRTDLRQVVICGVYFWVGAAFFRYRIDKYFSITSVVIAAIIWVSLSRWPETFAMASWLILPFIVLAFGLASSPWLSRMTRYDYSYGIYIYSFPVQQVVAKFWPDMYIGIYLFITLLVTIILAALSWHWVEHPSLSLKPARPTSEK